MNQSIIILAVIFSIIFPVHGQIIGFDASGNAGTVSNSDIKMYFQALAMTAGSSRLRPYIGPDKRGDTGISVFYPMAFADSRTMEVNNGIVPSFFLNFKVSDNLYFTGAMSSLNAGPNIGQIMSYGFNALLGAPESGVSSIQWTRTTVTGLRDFRLRSTDFMINRSFKVLGGMKIGVGTTLYKVFVFSSLKPFFVSNYESSMGYVIAGYELSYKGINLFPMARVNAQHVQLGVDCSLEFY